MKLARQALIKHSSSIHQVGPSVQIAVA